MVDSSTGAFLEEAVALAEAALETALPPADAPPTGLHEAMRYAVFAGGKRVRPALVHRVHRVGAQRPHLVARAPQPHDAGVAITRSYIQSDLVILLTPLTLGGYASPLKRAVDRLLGLISPFFTTIEGETHHRPRYAKYPALLGVGLMDPAWEGHPTAGEESAIFRELLRRNALNFHAPAHYALLFGKPDAEAVEEVRRMSGLLASEGAPPK